MSIKDLPEIKVIEQTINIITNQQKNLARVYILENIKKILEEKEGDPILFDERISGFTSKKGEYLSTDSDFIRSLKSYQPKLYNEIKKNKKNIRSLLENFVDTHEIKMDAITEKNRKKLFEVLRSIAREHQTETTETSVTNLANAMIHNPSQSFFYARKKAIEMEEVSKKKIAEDTSEIQAKRYIIPTVKIEYRIKEAPDHFTTLYIPELFSLTRCQVFYYEEDYYDCVNGETLLIDIKDKTIKFGNDTEVWKKEDLVEKQRIGNIVYRYPNLDYLFLYKHKRFGTQCIGGLTFSKRGGTTITIHNHHDGLRYGTKYINENNQEYRYGSCTKDGDVCPELVAKDTADFIDVVYKMFPSYLE